MLILFFVILLGLLIWRLIDTDCDLEFDSLGIFTVVCIVIDFIAILICLGCLLSINRTIPKRIAIYEEENTRIEAQLNVVVEQYMQHEENIFLEIAKNESAITLVSLYPELKSDNLVQSQIDTYIKNNDKIKELRSLEAGKSTLKFWLYFGG